MNNAKQALILCAVQVIYFSILCVNFRAIAQAEYHTAAVSDMFIASIQFFVIRKIATAENSTLHWLGYVIGSIIGSYLGIYISTKI